MLNNRIPDVKDLNKLTRDEWESLCSNLCSILFQVNRVEDRRGKGNGLDAWRILSDGTIEGFQFRKFDDRFGYKQATHIKENITLAFGSILKEFGKPLSKFTLIINIDLEPGHCNKKGETEYFKDICEWANAEYELKVTYHGVAWVLAKLLANPFLMPNLFENLPQLMEHNKNLLVNEFKVTDSKVDLIYDMLNDIKKEAKSNEKIGNIICKITSEALTHYHRGKEYQQIDKISLAIRSMEDAKRLLEIDDINKNLLGKVLCALCGLKTLAGYLEEALKDGKKAEELLESSNDKTLILYSIGNVAYNLYQSREEKKCIEAQNTFIYLLEKYEKDGHIDDILLTLIHITGTCIYLNDLEGISYWSQRIHNIVESIINIRGCMNDLCLSAIGTLGNALFQCGMETNNMMQIQEAYETFNELEQIARRNRKKFILAVALGQKAMCLWNLNDIEGADHLFGMCIEESKVEFKKNAADSLYNRALLNIEKGNKLNAKNYLEEAKKIYIDVNDMKSAYDTEIQIGELKK